MGKSVRLDGVTKGQEHVHQVIVLCQGKFEPGALALS